VHFGTFTGLTDEPIDEPAHLLAEAGFRVPRLGETVVLGPAAQAAA
jgi:hypothetical protein